MSQASLQAFPTYKTADPHVRYQYYAALDIGTVSSRLFIAQCDASTIIPLVRQTTITDLGKGVDSNHTFAPDAIACVVACMKNYATTIKEFQADHGAPVLVRAVATSAARDASNAHVLQAQLAALGIDLEVIPGSEEASLSFLGASEGFAGQRLCVLDIGGGSTEVIAGTGADAPWFGHSFNVGCRRVTEKFLHTDPPSPAELNAAAEWIRGQFQSLLAQHSVGKNTLDRVIAVAGTATSCVSISQKMEHYDPARVHGVEVSRAQVEDLFKQLSALTLEERRTVTGLMPGRAPVIVAGFLILRELLDLLGMSEFTVSEHDILEGIILSSAHRMGQ